MALECKPTVSRGVVASGARWPLGLCDLPHGSSSLRVEWREAAGATDRSGLVGQPQVSAKHFGSRPNLSREHECSSRLRKGCLLFTAWIRCRLS